MNRPVHTSITLVSATGKGDTAQSFPAKFDAKMHDLYKREQPNLYHLRFHSVSFLATLECTRKPCVARFVGETPRK